MRYPYQIGESQFIDWLISMNLKIVGYSHPCEHGMVAVEQFAMFAGHDLLADPIPDALHRHDGMEISFIVGGTICFDDGSVTLYVVPPHGEKYSHIKNKVKCDAILQHVKALTVGSVENISY